MNQKFTRVFLCLLLALSSCDKNAPAPPAAAEPQRFEVKGILRAIGFADREVTVEHEEIPGYMPAMTMPFSVRDMAEVERFSAGDAIQFQFVVTKDDSWITNVRKIDRSGVKLSEANRGTTATAAADRLREGDRLPTFALVDDQARQVTDATFRGKPLVLTFIFTRCPVPNFCPLMSKNFSRLREETAKNPELSDTQLLSVSFDPEYDTPEILGKYAAQFRDGEVDRWRFTTGTKAEVEKLTSRFSIHVKPEGGTIDHGLATVLVDRAGVIRKIWRGNGWDPAEVLQELAKL